MDENDKRTKPESGVTYLLEECKKIPEKTIQLFSDEIENGRKGLYISRTNPDMITKKYISLKHSRTTYYWLGESVGDNNISGKATSKVQNKIINYARGNRKPIIILDGIEYMITQNNFSSVLKTLQNLNEVISSTEAILLVPFSPKAFDEKEVALLEREFEIYPTS